jgi:5-methylcytosine-specific restriction endonuclease McrA
MTGDVLLLNADGLPSVLPLSTMTWQDAVKAVWMETVSVVEYYPDWVVHSPTLTLRVPSIVMNKTYVYFERENNCNPENIFLRDKYTCAYCSDNFYHKQGMLSLDHIFPKSLGGKITWTNAITSCKPCNNKKGNDIRVRPKFSAYEPSYFDLVAKRRQFPIIIPEESWVQYLSWPDENVVVRQRKRSLIQLAA